MYIESYSLDKFTSPWVKNQHIARYEWVFAYANVAHVLDVACGTGYGLNILLNYLNEIVVGVDISHSTLTSAKHNVISDKVLLLQADASYLPISDKFFNLITSFETIEHISEDSLFLEEVQRVLSQDGHFIISSPNRRLMSPGNHINSKPYNPHHVREYTYSELMNLLEKYFSVVEVYGQSFYYKEWIDFLSIVSRISKKVSNLFQIFGRLISTIMKGKVFHFVSKCDYLEPEIYIFVCKHK